MFFKYNEEALSWLEKAAEQGHPKAQYDLGSIYYGEGLTSGDQEQYKKAFPLLKQAGEQGNFIASITVGLMYQHGDGVEEDIDQALHWYQRSKEQGHPTAEHFIQQIKKDNPEIFSEANKSHQVDESTKQTQEEVSENDLIQTSELTKDQVSDIIVLAKASINTKNRIPEIITLVDQGDAEAQYTVASWYQEGWRGRMNFKEAFQLFEKSAKQGYAPAQYQLGGYYEIGVFADLDEEGLKYFVKSDEQKAIHWYRKAAEQGYLDAQYQLGEMLFGEKQYKEAFEWLERAALQGHSIAQHYLVMMYKNGEGVPKDLVMVYAWREQSTMYSSEEILKYINELKKSMTKSQIAEAKKKSQELAQQIEQNIKLASESKSSNCADEFKNTKA